VTEGLRGISRPLSVAPMMDRTDRHFRFLLRLITERTLLYTEMVTTGAILHGDHEELLGFSPVERPLALQLGGESPAELAACARIAFERGYDEINLNVGCPSDRVQHGRFGACLMAEPERVAEAIRAMREAVVLPVTVKHRIGIDDRDSYDDLLDFVSRVAEAGCDRFIVHARKAILQGLSPKQNRSVPPLRYQDVHRLKGELPHLRIEINGGFSRVAEIEEQLSRVDGVMVGRAAFDDPFLLSPVDEHFFGAAGREVTPRQVLTRYVPYLREWHEKGVPLGRLARGLAGFLAGRRGARAWRRHLTEKVLRPGARVEDVEAMVERL